MLSWMLKRSKIFMVLFLLCLIVGIYTFISLPQRELPEFSVNAGTITTIYPGATVQTVERDITNPIEEKLSTIDGIDEYSSSSAAGVSSIILTVEDGQDKNEVFSNVRQAVSDAASTFPDSVTEPNVTIISGGTAISSYTLTSDNQNELYDLKDEMVRWKEEIESIPGVSMVQIKGVTDEQITINLDSEKLSEYGIQFPTILTSINEEFSPTPLGKKEQDGQIVQLAIDSYGQIEELKKLYVGTSTDGNSIYLSDVGQILLESKPAKDLISYNDTPAISFTVNVKPGEDIPSIDESVSKKMMELSNSLPSSIEFNEYYSQATLVTDIFKGLYMSLAIAVIAVILTSSLGLSLSGAFVMALAVPLSVLIGLIPLPFANVDLNQISIIGAIIALGILVDDSIVVNDNIQRRYRLGDGALAGAVNGVKEIWVSIVTSTLAIVFTFSPLIFLSGGNGAFIRALPTVLITTILASTIVALFFVPMVRYQLYKRSNKMISDTPGLLGKPLNKLADWYADRVLRSIGKRPVIISLVGLMITTGIFGLVAFTPFEFFPAADREEVTIDVTLPIGTTLEETYEELSDMADVLSQDEGVFETSIFAGTGVPGLFTGSMDITGEYTGQIVVRVDRENQTAKGLIDEWTEPLRSEFSNATIFMNTIEQGPPSGAPVTVTISGPEIEKLTSIQASLQDRIEELGTELVLDNIGKPEPTISYSPNRETMEEYGISINQISEQIRLTTDGIPLSSFDNGITKKDMTLFIDRLQPEDSLQLSDIEIFAPSPTGPPSILTLDELLEENKTEELQRIPHLQGERSIVLRAFPGEVENFKEKVTTIVEDERSNLDDENYQISMGGENQAQNDFFAEIIVLFTIVIFLIYLLIAFQFNSLSLPFLVLVAVYLAIAGAIFGLFVTQTPISFLAVMGMVSLTGIVVRNSVVLIEFMEQGINKGMSLLEAVMESGRARIRPILLTALTSIVALIPIAVSGDALFTPLAVTIIAGILFSTILTLVIVPGLYLVFYRFRKNKRAID